MPNPVMASQGSTTAGIDAALVRKEPVNTAAPAVSGTDVRARPPDGRARCAELPRRAIRPRAASRRDLRHGGCKPMPSRMLRERSSRSMTGPHADGGPPEERRSRKIASTRRSTAASAKSAARDTLRLIWSSPLRAPLNTRAPSSPPKPSCFAFLARSSERASARASRARSSTQFNKLVFRGRSGVSWG